ncbi:hypothetical protein D8674_003643 [Pyrus ussuriensis x Pyrus communis]|uniref:Uncharacterized protein n=1 Tax=Pyrus ussuriensis x Pyrus communis TaxID=2448454 RepID=A0A5N5FHM2_9ROSA|nr:hypothetical protein D8674_003643 [Pyrus ussuriensis x Pyrus communis]
MTTPCPMTTAPTTATTAPAKMDHRPMNLVDPVGLPVPQAPASSTYLVALLVSSRHAHRRPRTLEQIRTKILITSTRTCWRTTIGSFSNATSSGKVTCTSILRCLMICRSLSRRVARRSWRTEKIVGFGSAKKVKANKSNSEKKNLLHHSGSRPFSYMMDARWKATMVEKGQSILQESAYQLPLNTSIEFVDPSEDTGFHILIETLD